MPRNLDTAIKQLDNATRPDWDRRDSQNESGAVKSFPIQATASRLSLKAVVWHGRTVYIRRLGSSFMPFIPANIDKLKFAYTFTLGLDPLPPLSPKTRALWPVTAAFQNNIMRLKRMMLAPAFIGDLANRIQRYTDIAGFEVTGTVHKGRFPPDEQSDKIFERLKALLKEDTAQVTSEIGNEERLLGIVRDSVETGGSSAVMLASSPPQSTGFEALLLSYITSMWTAFETLAGDLWESAINEKPNLLAQLKGKSNRLRKGRRADGFSSTRTDRDEDTGKSVRLDLIQFHQWNLSNKMGTILKLKYEFSRLESIREAHASAFCQKADNIDKILSDDALDVLSAIRNVIVHKGAIADREYLARCKYLSKLPHAEEGQEVPLDGEIVSSAIGEALSCSAHLIGAVDEWITAH